MTFPFKAGSPCPSASADSPSTMPYMGSGLSTGPASSGGAASMISVNQPCQCSTSCCGGDGGSGPAGGSGPVGGFGPGGGMLMA
jgi:hypothetical protein